MMVSTTQTARLIEMAERMAGKRLMASKIIMALQKALQMVSK